MEQNSQSFIEQFTKTMSENIDKLIVFYNGYHFIMFCQLRKLLYENISCLLLGLNQASIFTTNHLLERMLKVALTETHTKGYFIGNPKFDKRVKEAKEKYDKATLNNTITYAFEQGIITEEEKTKLVELKNEFRNPFSHAQMSSIVKEVPPFFKGFSFNFSKIKEAMKKGEQIPMKEKIIPTDIFYQSYQSDIANEKAFDYLKTVYEIMIAIDKRYQN